MARILLPITVTVLFPLWLSAQHAIKGRVLDGGNGSPMAYATIMCYDGGWNAVKSAVSGNDGRFVLEPNRGGVYSIVATMVGYAADTIAADTRTGAVDVGDMKLRAGVEIDEVTVSAQRMLFTQLSDRFVYDVSSDPDAKKKKMSEIMEKIPLLTIKPDDGKLAYLGSGAIDLLIDGERHEMINNAFQYPMRMIRGDVMDKIEIIPPGSPEYNNTRPIINIKTARSLPNGYAAEINGRGTTDNSLNGGLSLVSKVRDKVIFSFGYRFGYSDPSDLNSATLRKTYDGGVLTDVQDSRSVYGSSSRRHDISLRGSAKLFGNYLRAGVRTSVGESRNHRTLDMVRYDGDEQEIDRQSTVTHGSSDTKPRISADASYSHGLPNSYRIDYDYSYTDNLNLSESISRMPNLSDPAAGTGSGRMSQSRTGSSEHAFRIQARQFMKLDRHRVSAALNYTQRRYENASEYNRWDALEQEWTTDVLRNKGLNYTQRVGNIGAAYMYYDKKISGSAGLNLTYERDMGTFRYGESASPLNYEKVNLMPSISLSSRIKKFGFSAGYSMGIVRPDVNKLDPYVNDADSMNLITGNPGLDPERSHNFRLGMSRSFVAGRRMITLDMLYSRISNAIESITEVDPSSKISTTTWDNIGSRNSLSVKLMLLGVIAREWCNLMLVTEYHRIEYRIPSSERRINTVSGFAGGGSFWVKIWPTGQFDFDYTLNSDTGVAQNGGVTYSHQFKFSFSQTILKGKLFATAWVDNPFDSRRYISSLTADRNFSIAARNERRGRVIGFSIRGNFGRFRDRVGEAESLNTDRARESMPSR